MFRGVLFVLVAALVLPACRNTSRGVCAWRLVEPARGITDGCREVTGRSACEKRDVDSDAHFTPSTTCPALGYTCFSSALGGAYHRPSAAGECPPRTEAVTGSTAQTPR